MNRQGLQASPGDPPSASFGQRPTETAPYRNRVLPKPRGREEVDGERCAAFEAQVGEDLTEDAGELEAVPGETRRERDLRKAWVPVDQEVLVGGQRVEAGSVAVVGWS